MPDLMKPPIYIHKSNYLSQLQTTILPQAKNNHNRAKVQMKAKYDAAHKTKLLDGDLRRPAPIHTDDMKLYAHRPRQNHLYRAQAEERLAHEAKGEAPPAQLEHKHR
ncbi:hypothetical protein CLU79DRAFT_719641 [Phycomyces nitens]|nr:hypothetical protein CLU79DRAFT_719641 [Phycomyces nitens]